MSTPPAFQLRWFGLTDVGRFRKNNEDAFLAINYDANDVRRLGKVGQADFGNGDFVFAVSDGMGGANAGEYASRIAVDKITDLLPKAFRLGVMGMSAGAGDVLSELFSRINATMNEISRHYEECAGMGATLSLCWFRPEWVYFCHIGDSRIYYLPANGPMRQITDDHTHVGWLFRQGKINEREARSHPSRNNLNQVLGAQKNTIDPQHGSVGYASGDRFLLCTDGLCEGLWDRGIENLIREPIPALAQLNPAQRLIQESKLVSGRDNLTALVVEIT